jgi:hypothetical protein
MAPELAPDGLAQGRIKRNETPRQQRRKRQKTSSSGTQRDLRGQQGAHFETAPFGEATPNFVIVQDLHAGSHFFGAP